MEAPLTEEHFDNYKKATSWNDDAFPEMWESSDVSHLLDKLPNKNKNNKFLAKHLNNIWAGPAITIGGITLAKNKNKSK
jgi:hypothetical protein